MEVLEANAIKSFCARPGVSRSPAYRAIAAGRLDARQIGNHTVVLRAEAERWAHALPKARSA